MSLLLGVSYVFWSVAMVVDQPAVGVSDLGASVAAATMGGCSQYSPCKEKTASKACNTCNKYGDKWNKCASVAKGFQCSATPNAGYDCVMTGTMTCSGVTGKEYENQDCTGIGKTVNPCKMTVATGTTCP